MWRINLNILAAVCIFLVAVAGPAAGRTIYVDPNGSADFTTIQVAIDDANDGDEIEVAPGAYYESATYSVAIDLMGKAIRLYSSGGPEVTTINGNGRYHVVVCARDEGPDTILEGFTITGGYACGYDIHNYGAGMLNYINSCPTVTNCNFSGNSALEGGGGMYNYANSSPMVTNCTFTGNSAGGMGGGGMCNFSSSPTVTNCTFNGNSLGGMCNLSSSPTVTNCILWGDSGFEIFNYSSSANVTYSNVEGGWSGTGNIDANPLFVDAAAGNLRLRDLSPCADAGNNNAVPAGVTSDLDGNPRFVDDASMPDTGSGTAPIVDMGAYERQISSVGPICNVTRGLYYLQIQSAIDAASNGDEIEVAVGTYYEAINFKGKSVRLYSIGGPEVTIIDGTGNYHVVQCVSSEGPDTILEGFTITGGNANGTGSDNGGGGMYNDNCSPTVSTCTFTGNRAGNGAGMLNNDSSPTLTNCTFSGNTATVNGGGMSNHDSSPTVTNCTFSGNSASGFLGGLGGGMCNANNSNPKMTNCTLSANTARDEGGGMYNIFNSSPTATNCILWDDRPNEIVDGDIFSSSTVSYSDVQGGWWSGTGNIEADPCLVDSAAGNLRLGPWSPCIDAGNNNASGIPATDLDGHPRMLDGDCDDNAVVDMGAYEFNYAYMGDLDYNCRVDFFDFSIFGPAWMTQEGDTNWDWACDMSDPPDDYIDWRDIRVLCNNWLAGTEPEL